MPLPSIILSQWLIIFHSNPDTRFEVSFAYGTKNKVLSTFGCHKTEDNNICLLTYKHDSSFPGGIFREGDLASWSHRNSFSLLPLPFFCLRISSCLGAFLCKLAKLHAPVECLHWVYSITRFDKWCTAATAHQICQHIPLLWAYASVDSLNFSACETSSNSPFFQFGSWSITYRNRVYSGIQGWALAYLSICCACWDVTTNRSIVTWYM